MLVGTGNVDPGWTPPVVDGVDGVGPGPVDVVVDVPLDVPAEVVVDDPAPVVAPGTAGPEEVVDAGIELEMAGDGAGAIEDPATVV